MSDSGISRWESISEYLRSLAGDHAIAEPVMSTIALAVLSTALGPGCRIRCPISDEELTATFNFIVSTPPGALLPKVAARVAAPLFHLQSQLRELKLRHGPDLDRQLKKLDEQRHRQVSLFPTQAPDQLDGGPTICQLRAIQGAGLMWNDPKPKQVSRSVPAGSSERFIFIRPEAAAPFMSADLLSECLQSHEPERATANFALMCRPDSLQLLLVGADALTHLAALHLLVMSGDSDQEREGAHHRADPSGHKFWDELVKDVFAKRRRRTLHFDPQSHELLMSFSLQLAAMVEDLPFGVASYIPVWLDLAVKAAGLISLADSPEDSVSLPSAQAGVKFAEGVVSNQTRLLAEVTEQLPPLELFASEWIGSAPGQVLTLDQTHQHYNRFCEQRDLIPLPRKKIKGLLQEQIAKRHRAFLRHDLVDGGKSKAGWKGLQLITPQDG